MGASVSLIQLFVIPIVLFLFIFPFWKILPRSGIPAWVSLFVWVPFVSLILLWVMALKKWPTDDVASTFE